MHPRIGVSVMPLENRREVVIGLATEADRLGYDGFFMPETWAFDMTVLLAEAAVRTHRIAVGTGILGIWNRSAATIAMAASTLHGISGGRFVLGLGTSTPQLAEGLHDTPFEAPVARMRRIVTQVRALLRGERIPLAITTKARALKLNVPAAPELPIYLAALGDASTRLAGELGDAWVPFLYPWSQFATGVERLREGAARGGHPDRVPIICPSVPVVVAEDAAKAREGAAWFVSFYLTTMGTIYRDSLTRQGYGKEVEAVLDANVPKFAGAVPADAEELLEQLIVYGTPAEARRRLARWHAAGASMPVLLLRPSLTPAEIALTLEAFRPMLEFAHA
jgi:alkanesulfonate monooxygenase SsuD/methylene tetrahydromethanopterin reductase-like flavin-dependent oxidoreductase (luciferase family)